MMIYVWTALLAALAIAVYVRAWGERPILNCALLVMRLAILVALGTLLMGPSHLPDRIQHIARQNLAILLDTSQSMLTHDCGEVTRFRFAVDTWLNASQLVGIAQHCEVELWGFDAKLRPLPIAALNQNDSALATGTMTNLADCLNEALLRRQTGSSGELILLISDGHDSADASLQPAISLAQSRGISIHTVCLGGSNFQRDVALLAVPMQEYLLAGEPGEMAIKAYQVGLDRAVTNVEVTCGHERTTLPVQFQNRRMVELRVPIRQDKPGQYEYKVRIAPVEGETEYKNNEQTVFCDVARDRIKVLILEGQPYWETKFLAQSLRKDERIELTQMSQLSEIKKETIVTRSNDAAPLLPRTAEALSKFDVIILGRNIEKMQGREIATLLKEFVASHGGHIIFARGMAYDPSSSEGMLIAQSIAELEPVIWGRGSLTDLSLSLTAAGRSSPWLAASKVGVDLDQALSRLPGFRTMPAIEREKPAAIVLMRARPLDAPPVGTDDGQPALVSMNYGRGTVVALLGEGLWQWSLLDQAKRDLAGVYDAFWSNLVRYLAMGGDFQPGQEVSLKLSRNSIYLGDQVMIDVVFKIAPQTSTHPTVTVVDPNGKAEQIVLSRLPRRDPRFRASYAPAVAGVHRVTLNTPDLTPSQQQRGFNVQDVTLERLETSADPALMRQLAQATGGETFHPNEPDRFLQKLQRRSLASIIPTEPKYIWDNGAILFIMLLWLGLEWLMRRKAGLL
jgi:hypothetical protein